MLKGYSGEETLPSAMSTYSIVPSKSNVKTQPRPFIRFSVVKYKSNSKDPFFRPSWSLAMHSLFDHICSCLTCFQQRYAYLLGQDNIRGQIHLQSRTTGLHELMRGLIPSKASFPTEQNDGRYFPDLVHKNNNPGGWPLPGIAASIALYSGSKMPNQLL